MNKSKRKNCLPGIDGGYKSPNSIIKGGKFPGSSAFQMKKTALPITDKQRNNLPEEVVEAIVAKEQREGNKAAAKMTKAPMNFLPGGAGIMGGIAGAIAPKAMDKVKKTKLGGIASKLLGF